jgi:hypothetical protein
MHVSSGSGLLRLIVRGHPQSRNATRRCSKTFTIFLWLLKLGVLVNLYFLANTLVPPGNTADPRLLVPAQILFAVSGFRCLFPNQYKGNVVFHDTPLSSIFLTRLLATFAEVAFWEELGWAIVVVANAVASAGLYSTRDARGDAATLIHINLVFGLVYLSWQVANLRLQIVDAKRGGETLRPATRVSWKLLGAGMRRSIRERKRTTEATAWGGLVGLLWMTAYFATLLPMWANQIVAEFSR